MPQTRKIIRFLLALVALTTPLYILRFSVVGVPFSLPEVLIYATFAFYLIWITIHRHQIAWHINKKLIFLVWAILSLIILIGIIDLPSEISFEGESYQPIKVALGIWKGWIIAPFLYFFLIVQNCPDRVGKALIKRGFLLGATGLALWSILLGEWSPDHRLLGFFTNPNYLALYLTPALWVVVEEIIATKKSHLFQLEKIFYLIIILLGIFFTRSYAAVMAIGLISTFRIAVLMKGWKRWSILAIVALILGGFLFKEYSSEKFTQSFEFEQRSSMSVRLQIWEVATHISKRNILEGVGLGQFQLTYWQDAWDDLGCQPYEWNIGHSHNLYLQWLVETGIFGLILFILFVSLILKHKPLDGGVDLRFAIGIILIHGLLDLPFWKQDLAIEFMLICGLIVAGNYCISDTVKIGEKQTEDEIGIPSINLNEKLFLHYEDGMYAAIITWRGQKFPALGYIGYDAVFKKTRRAEFHILNVKTNMYGDDVDVEIIEKIRDRKKYKTSQEFKIQLAKDIAKAKKIFKIS